MCRSGNDSRNNKRIPKWDVKRTAHMPSVKSSPWLQHRDRGMSGLLCWWAGAFPNAAAGATCLLHAGTRGCLLSLQTSCRFLVCRMLRSSGATLPGLACPEVLGEKATKL